MWSFSSTAIKSQYMSHKCLWGIASVAFNSIWELWNWYQDPLLYMLLIIQQFEIFHKFLMKINTFRKYDQVQQHLLLEPQNFWQHKTKCIQQIHIVIHLKSKILKTNDLRSQHIKNSPTLEITYTLAVCPSFIHLGNIIKQKEIFCYFCLNHNRGLIDYHHKNFWLKMIPCLLPTR